MYVIGHDKYLPDNKIDTYLGLVLATQFYFCYTFLFTNLNVYVSSTLGPYGENGGF